MIDHLPDDHDYWEMTAASMDLGIEGQRLIVQDIAFELKLLWRRAVAWVKGSMHPPKWWRAVPPG